MRLLKSDKGIGTVVAFVMFLMITILFMGGTVLWQAENQDHMTALGKDRTDERISVQATYKWDGEEYSVTVKVSNIGIIDVELVRLWILDMDHSHGNSHLCIDISYPLSVGEQISIAESEITDLINSFDNDENPIFNPPEGNPDYPFDVAETTYYFKVVTARGNIANSLLVPYSVLESHWPAVIMPGASNVTKKKHGPGAADIHLEVYNSLDETITIDLIVATLCDTATPQTEIIDVIPDWPLISGDITVGDFEGEDTDVFKDGRVVLIELVNIAGLVVSSYYFTVK